VANNLCADGTAANDSTAPSCATGTNTTPGNCYNNGSETSQPGCNNGGFVISPGYCTGGGTAEFNCYNGNNAGGFCGFGTTGTYYNSCHSGVTAS